jgi:hypothetical protein
VPSTPRPAANPTIVPKPHSSHSVRPLTPFSVTLTASSTNLWPTQVSTLTATTNQDVGPTPYWISIYDDSSGDPGPLLVTCGNGTSCATQVTAPGGAERFYVAYVLIGNSPPTGIQATSDRISVNWKFVELNLVASPTTVPLGGFTTLTVTDGGIDVGPSPLYFEVYDLETNARVGNPCGVGTVCAVDASNAVAGTHRFIGVLGSLSATYPPAALEPPSNLALVTWTASSWHVSLSFTYLNGDSEAVLTALTNQDVGPTPYYIELFDIGTQTFVAECGFGTNCSTTTTLRDGANTYVAFVSGYGTGFLPPTIQASSNLVSPYHSFVS